MRDLSTVLVSDRAADDDESVVGEECHIISGSAAGPRYDATVSGALIDDVANLILLCRVHHKIVDDQTATYTAARLRELKAEHEMWVESKLQGSDQLPPVRVKRFKNEIPLALPMVASGQELFNLASGCHASYQYHPDDLTDTEVELVGGFLQNLKDWIDIAADGEPLEKVRAVNAIADDMTELKGQGFVVFAAQERQQTKAAYRHRRRSSFSMSRCFVILIRESLRLIVRHRARRAASMCG